MLGLIPGELIAVGFVLLGVVLLAYFVYFSSSRRGNGPDDPSLGAAMRWRTRGGMYDDAPGKPRLLIAAPSRTSF